MSRFLVVTGLLLVVQALFVPGGYASPTYREPDPGELRTIPDTHPKPYLTARDHLAVGDTDETLAQLRVSLRSFPYHRPTIGLYLGLLEDTSGTSVLYETIRRHYRRNERSQLFEGFFRSERGTGPSHVPLIEWLNERDTNAYFSRVLARGYLESGSLTEAERLVRKGLDRFPDDSRLRLLLARVFGHRGECSRALKEVNVLLRRRPGWSKPYRLKTQLLWSSNGPRARELLERYEDLRGPTARHGPETINHFSCSFTGGSFKKHS